MLSFLIISAIPAKLGDKLNNLRYQLRIIGLEESAGQIKSSHMRCVIDALAKTAKCVTHLRATGSGDIKHSPKWLTEATDFTITGLQSGSTTLPIALPPLRDTGFAQFCHQLFDTDPLPFEDATALDLVSNAVNDVNADNPAEEYFDYSVLKAILNFKKATGASVHYELESLAKGRDGFSLGEEQYSKIHARIQETPLPESVIVSGVLNEIKHADGHFRLVLANKSKILGRVDPKVLNREKLRELWGKSTTIAGTLHRRADKQPRILDAQKISSQVDGDQVFEKLPTRMISKQLDLLNTTVAKKSKQSTGPMILWNTWPGDESIDELLKQLD